MLASNALNKMLHSRQVKIFMDATLSAVSIDVKFLQTKLSADNIDSSANNTPTAGETLNHLFQQCDSSLVFLQSLCEQQIFRESIVKNKEFSGNEGVFVLVRAVLSLKVSPSYSTLSSYMASVSRLKTKALSILLYLCETENVSYLDEIASNIKTRNLAKAIVLQVLELLKTMFGVDTTAPKTIYPKGQLELNAMRIVDMFSDDSNFRPYIMMNFTETLAATFSLPHGEFLSGWCSTDLPVCEDDGILDVPRASYAHQRTSLFIKVIANLHCFVPDVCQDEKNHFFQKFISFLQKESSQQASGSQSSVDPEKSTAVTKNLYSLLTHAESLVPEFINEEDVHLLRLFIDQFKALLVPAASVDQIQDAQNTEECSSSLHKGVAPNHDHNGGNVEVDRSETVASRETDQLIISGNAKKSEMAEQIKYIGPTTHLREVERDSRITETSGSDSSPTRGKNSIDRLDADQVKGSGFDETLEDEKVDAINSDDRQQRKRKRTVMNDKQIALIESALVDEPDMHRNAVALRSWADKLSLHGAEVTTSRLKNWLNNRKARLARAAKDVRVSYEGENLGKQGGSEHLDSPQSPMDDTRVRGSVRTEVIDTALTSNVDVDLGTTVAVPQDVVKSGVNVEAGQYVMLLGENGEKVGKGKVFQVHGKWCGNALDQSGMCVVDVWQLSVDRSSKVPHPMEVTGTTFDQAAKRLGLMRVLWDLNKLIKSPLI
ncbi:nodulin homeobox isoform X2 [Andrographis paniculata]|uniref:nodulin homeobox isoform X2 n=1 Tax=Andrographis paniculata TaxID=175694 RepID=UPI0021E84695|nr:nodulin homeobox isoform X2 [Andrographis paniculata]